MNAKETHKLLRILCQNLKKITKFRYGLVLILLVHTTCWGQIYLFGFPRSGNHLLAYSLSHILNQEVIYQPYAEPKILVKPYNFRNYKNWYLHPINRLPVNSLFFAHEAKNLGLDRADQSTDFLIVIVRDYHECFVREFYTHFETYEDTDIIALMNFSKCKYSNQSTEDCYSLTEGNYNNFLQCYDSWNENTRHLIYFEDLVTNFESTIQDCLDKLNFPKHYLPLFMRYYDQKMHEIKTIYRNYQKDTLSEGDVHYHKKRLLTIDQAMELDALFKDNYPDLWDKYLKRYETNPEAWNLQNAPNLTKAIKDD